MKSAIYVTVTWLSLGFITAIVLGGMIPHRATFAERFDAATANQSYEWMRPALEQYSKRRN